MPSRARCVRIRATQARSSSSDARVGQRQHRLSWRTFSQRRDGLAADALGRRVRRDELGVLGLERAQLVEQRVVVVVADLRVVEDVVAVAVVVAARSRSSRGAASRLRPRRSLHLLGRRARAAARGRSASSASMPVDVGQVEVQRRDGDAPGGDRRQVGARLVLEAGVGAVDPVAARRAGRSSS